MATTTTNFGWDIPQSTDLVKDGATAIAALGQDIDTAMVDLKGGTTGQVLAKASGTDLDFSWVAQDDSNAIQNAIVDAKGDLISATAADTPARLAVGTNGHVLTADSTEATGIKWAAPAGGGKVLQVVNAVYSTATTITSASYTDTGLSATITPSSATSKVLVIVSQQAYTSRSVGECAAGFQVLRGATIVVDPGTSPNSLGIGASGAASTFANGNYSVSYLDSPATTSATTYKVQSKPLTTGNSSNVIAQIDSSRSTITLMEIGA
jgi:hypothetical protein